MEPVHRGRSELKGIGASPGIAIGPAYVYDRSNQAKVEKATLSFEQVEAEIERLRTAISRAREGLILLRDHVARETGEEEAAIFDAHLLMLDDLAFAGRAENLVRQEMVAAEWAVKTALEEVTAVLAGLPDEYLRARSSDVRDVALRVISALRGSDEHPLAHLPGPVIVVSKELTPSDTAMMDRDRVLGFVMEGGSRTSHVAILARTMGIPAVVGAAGAMALVDDGDTVATDGDSGEVVVRPSGEEEAEWQERRLQRAVRERRLREIVSLPAVTPDGHRVELAANIASPGDLQTALAFGAEGVGLFRTEFLFMDRDGEPGEEEQFAAYGAVAEALGGRPLIIRTLDVGGDKDIGWLHVEEEANSFLGLRGLRLCLAREEMFLTQLRAILRARTRGNVWVMFPMVTDLEEVRAARRLLAKAAEQLRSRGVDHDAGLPVGIMGETPSVAILADAFLDEVDFVSLGTNHLIQYTLAADRTNPNAARLWDDLHPAVLRLVARVAEAARLRGKWVGVCGGLAGEALAAPVLMGLGVRELSMAPPCLPAVKEVIRAMPLARAEAIARTVLACKTAAAVREVLESELAGLVGERGRRDRA